MKALKQQGFVQFANDNCMVKKETNEGIIIMTTYVDDCIMIGTKSLIYEELEDLKKTFSIKHKSGIQEFIGCTIERDGRALLLSQTKLIKKLLKEFSQKIEGIGPYYHPSPSGSHILKPTNEEALLPEDEQKEYRSGVGSLLLKKTLKT